MEKKKIITGVLIALVTLSVASVLVTLGVVIKNKKEHPESWVLHSYGNNVALYKDEEIIEVYGGIMLDTLPDEDKKLLDNGIVFSSREEAVSAIEDYDG